jgi:hypothetical protein
MNCVGTDNKYEALIGWRIKLLSQLIDSDDLCFGREIMEYHL